MSGAARYLRIQALTAVAFLCLFAAFNWIVDPYNLHGTVRIEGFNAIAGRSFNTPMLTKAFAIRRVKPRAVVIGSSRADHAIDVAHPGWRGSAQPRYNLAVERADICELMRFLEHAQTVQPLEQVVFGLDLFMFNMKEGYTEGFDDDILANRRSTRKWQALRRHAEVLLSYDTFLSSVSTIRSQRYMTPDYDGNGRRNERHYERSLKEAGGYAGLLARYESQFPNGFLHRLDFDDARAGSPMSCFRRVIETAREGGIDLRLYISPTHARDQDLWLRGGNWSMVELWKRELVRILAEDAAAHSDRTPIPLWDFSGYNSITTEVFPADSSAIMKWYWEPSHFKKKTGDMVLTRIFEHRELGHSVPEDFGAKIDAANIESHLERVRTEQALFHARLPAEEAPTAPRSST